jgi:hypothetical protein
MSRTRFAFTFVLSIVFASPLFADELSYSWPLPAQGWFTDRFDFPLPFAPSLPYGGFEDLHQLDGFGDAGSKEFWSYDFLFWLDGQPAITRASLERDLHDYYAGLCDYFGPPQVICEAAAFQSRVVALGQGSFAGRRAELFLADVSAIDPFFTGQPITLHMLLASFACPRDRHQAVLVAASPQPIGLAPWPGLIEEAEQLRCQ